MAGDRAPARSDALLRSVMGHFKLSHYRTLPIRRLRAGPLHGPSPVSMKRHIRCSGRRGSRQRDVDDGVPMGGRLA